MYYTILLHAPLSIPPQICWLYRPNSITVGLMTALMPLSVLWVGGVGWITWVPTCTPVTSPVDLIANIYNATVTPYPFPGIYVLPRLIHTYLCWVGRDGRAAVSIRLGDGWGSVMICTDPPPPPITTRYSVLDPTSTAVVTITAIYITPTVVSAASYVSLLAQVDLAALSVLSLAQSSTSAVLALIDPEVTARRDPSTYWPVQPSRDMNSRFYHFV